MLSRIFKIIRRDGFKNLFDKVLRRLQVGALKKHMKKKDWKRAAKNGEWLVNRYPNEINFHHKLARCYKENNNHDLATITLQEGLKKHLDLDETIDYIESIISPTGEVQTEYIYLGGEQNLGFFEHRLGKKKYLTKICNISSQNEIVFYLRVCKCFPKLGGFTPKIVNAFDTSQGISLITMEKIEGDIPLIEGKTLREVMDINRIITSINYNKLIYFFQLPDYIEEFKWEANKTKDSNLVRALKSFVTIQKEQTNKAFFYFFNRRMKALNYSWESRQLIRCLEDKILKTNLYKKLKPELHYSLQHGDFYLHNMLIDNKIKRIKVIDWGLFGIGPRWVDIAGFLGRTRLPFERIKSLFLLDAYCNNNLTSIEKIFFIYVLIVTWFIHFSREEFDNHIDLYLFPAIECLELILAEADIIF